MEKAFSNNATPLPLGLKEASTLLAGVGRANDASNVGNATNVYGPAASTTHPSCLKVFAEHLRSRKSQKNMALGDKKPNVTIEDKENFLFSINEVRTALYSVMGYVNPFDHLERLQPKFIAFLASEKANLEALTARLNTFPYKFSAYSAMTVKEPKERQIHFHSDWIDNVAETAVINRVRNDYMNIYSDYSFGSIKGRGTDKAVEHLKELAKENAQCHFFQFDIRKYYANTDKERLKMMVCALLDDSLERKFILTLTDSYEGEGIPIGVPMSQFNANLYLTPVDICLEQHPLVVGFARNMDDYGIVIRGGKAEAHALREDVEKWLAELGLQIKPNYRIAPLTYGMDILGYVIRPTHTRLRKHIKESMKLRDRQLRKGGVSDSTYRQQMASYYGWCLRANASHLLKTVFNDKLKLFKHMRFQRLNKTRTSGFFSLERDAFVSITELSEREIVILRYEQAQIHGQTKTVVLFAYADEAQGIDTEDELRNISHYTITRSLVMADRLKRDSALFPLAVTIHFDKRYTYYT